VQLEGQLEELVFFFWSIFPAQTHVLSSAFFLHIIFLEAVFRLYLRDIT
jgi:hypothetical protein